MTSETQGYDYRAFREAVLSALPGPEHFSPEEMRQLLDHPTKLQERLFLALVPSAFEKAAFVRVQDVFTAESLCAMGISCSTNTLTRITWTLGNWWDFQPITRRHVTRTIPTLQDLARIPLSEYARQENFGRQSKAVVLNVLAHYNLSPGMTS